MSLTFWLNNFHFALEFFGGAVFVVLAWLAFEAFTIKKDFKTIARGVGFSFFAIWLAVHSLNITNDIVLGLAASGYLLGLVLILLNLYLEMPPARPKLALVFVLPATASVLWVFHIPATVLLFLIALISFKRYRTEFQQTLFSFFVAFTLLAVASFLDIFNSRTSVQGVGWILEHILKLAGYGFLGYWGWQYLRLRIKEEIMAETGLSEAELPPDMFLDSMAKRVLLYLKEFEKNGINNLSCPGVKKKLLKIKEIKK